MVNSEGMEVVDTDDIGIVEERLRIIKCREQHRS